MNLSTNFTRKEFRCKGRDCCGNSAPINQKLVDALQELRDLVGVPLKVLSGFRCNKYNRSKEVGSKDGSQHTLGNAADIAVPKGYSVDDFAAAAEMVDAFHWGGIGRYYSKGFIHLDVRQGPARWEEE